MREAAAKSIDQPEKWWSDGSAGNGPGAHPSIEEAPTAPPLELEATTGIEALSMPNEKDKVDGAALVVSCRLELAETLPSASSVVGAMEVASTRAAPASSTISFVAASPGKAVDEELGSEDLGELPLKNGLEE